MSIEEIEKAALNAGRKYMEKNAEIERLRARVAELVAVAGCEAWLNAKNRIAALEADRERLIESVRKAGSYLFAGEPGMCETVLTEALEAIDKSREGSE
jgi:hypothetical protein